MMRGGCTSPLLAWLLSCVFANRVILLIVADHKPWFCYPLPISCCSCCESMWILVDRSGSLSICFSKSLQIDADLRRSICRASAISCQRLLGTSSQAHLLAMNLMGHLLECEYSLILEEDEGVVEIHIPVPDLEKAFKSCICILPMISCRKRFYTSPQLPHHS